MGRYLIAFVLICWGYISFAQQKVDSSKVGSSAAIDAPQAPEPKQAPMWSAVQKPILGMGGDLFSYFGNLKPKNYFQNPGVSNFAFTLSLSQPLNDYLRLNLYGLTGQLGVADDANTTRNANFQTKINLGGISLQYNFNQWLPKNRAIEPFISAGIEAFTFDSKIDLYAKNGSKYYYWSNGSIMNLPQNSPNAENAVQLVRDYNYETDIRNSNIYGQGMYANNSYAVPLGAGATFHLSERVDLNFHCIFHLSFTNYIDGLGSTGGKSMDNFMQTGFSLHWDLKGPKEDVDTLDAHWFDNVDFAALDGADSDGDGVRDTLDRCPNTPAGVSVDAFGCPTDLDNDGVPDYLDKEPSSKPNAIVDEFGVTVPDSIVKQRYLQFYDTTNRYATVITKFHGQYDNSGGKLIPSARRSASGTYIPDTYMVLLGSYKTGLPTEVMTKYLSIKDISTMSQSDSTIAYTVGSYKTFEEANQRLSAVLKDSIQNAKIVYLKDGKLEVATGELDLAVLKKQLEKQSALSKTKSAAKSGATKTTGRTKTGEKAGTSPIYLPEGVNKDDSILVATTKGVVFRIQLGAYSHRISKAVFKNVPNVIEIRTKDNLHKYLSGSYSSFAEAAKAKIDLDVLGYSGSFITAYKDGKRIQLTSGGATPSESNGEALKTENVTEPDKPMNSVDAKNIVFKVQIGVFKNEPPAASKAKFKALKVKVEEESTSTGLIRYTVGNTNNYKEIAELKNQMKQQGLEDAFIIAFMNNQYITVQEALELLK